MSRLFDGGYGSDSSDEEEERWSLDDLEQWLETPQAEEEWGFPVEAAEGKLIKHARIFSPRTPNESEPDPADGYKFMQNYRDMQNEVEDLGGGNWSALAEKFEATPEFKAAQALSKVYIIAQTAQRSP